jgi:hypothetical protein
MSRNEQFSTRARWCDKIVGEIVLWDGIQTLYTIFEILIQANMQFELTTCIRKLSGFIYWILSTWNNFLSRSSVIREQI